MTYRPCLIWLSACSGKLAWRSRRAACATRWSPHLAGAGVYDILPMPDLAQRLFWQVGMALEPGGLRDQMVTAAADGELKLIDFRMLGDAGGNAVPGLANGGGNAPNGGSMGVWKTVNASATSRNLSALAAHPNAPLLATGTSTQVRARSCSSPQLLVVMLAGPVRRVG